MYKTVLTSLAFALSAASLISVPATAVELSASAGLLYFDYQEFDTDGSSLNHETGIIPGLSLAAHEKAFGFEHTIALTAWQGRVDYQGQTQAGIPHTTNTDESIYKAHYRFDWQPENSMGGLYGKVSWQNWDRDIRPANGVSGLFERYQWWTLEAGLHADLYQADKHNIFVEFGVLATTNGTVKIDLSNSGYGEPTLDLGDGTGLAVRAGWSRLLNKNNSWSILFDYTRWDFGRSNSQSLSDGINSIIITEPESLSKQASLRFIYQHHF